MESHELKKLIDKYERGETSVKEEHRIKELLDTSKEDPGLNVYRSMFDFYDKERRVKLPGHFERQKETRLSWSWIAGIAASVLILMGVFIANRSGQEEELGTYENPEIAMQKTKEVLHLVSRYMNKGTEDLKYLNEFEKTKDKIITIK